MYSSIIEARGAPWRMLSLGSTVWAPFGDHAWRPGIVTGLGKNRGDNTVVHLAFETGGKGRRLASELYWHKAELKDADKPPKPNAMSERGISAAATVDMS
jgi:hypothetical protein